MLLAWRRRRRFIPHALSGLALWMDASRISGLADGAAVASWSDLSGNGRHATQGTGANQPLFETAILSGRPVVRFDGSGDALSTAAFGSPLAQPSTLILAGAARAFATLAIFCDGLAVDARLLFYRETDGDWALNAGAPFTSTTATDTAFHIATALVNGASSAIRVDGTQVAAGSAGLQALGGLHLGRSAGGVFGAVDLAEVILYNRALTAGEQRQIERYLSQKYGVAVS